METATMGRVVTDATIENLEDAWAGLQDAYRGLAADVRARYGVSLRTIGDECGKIKKDGFVRHSTISTRSYAGGRIAAGWIPASHSLSVGGQ